ncbi:MAG: TMEM175 family protein [Dokdonella sp.]
MDKGRLEAFSDRVIAVIITIMLLELKVPHAPTLVALSELWPVLLSCVLSFMYVGIYRNIQQHMFQTVEKIDGRVMWANLHLLFWISLFSFTTAWLSENHFAAVPAALYGCVLLMSAIAWPILARALIACNGSDGVLASAMRRDRKGKVSIMLYALAIALAFLNSWIACALYAAVAMIWLVPDRRMEKVVTS